jgi:hypothetical protein
MSTVIKALKVRRPNMHFLSISKQFKKAHSFQSFLLSLKLFAFFSILSYSNIVSAAEVTLVWDANTEPYLAGYMIYYGFASRTYDYVVDVGDQTTFTLSGLEEGHTYYFAVTAYDTEDFESDFSNEVSANFELGNQLSTGCDCDFDTDGDLDGSDLAVFATNFGRTDCFAGYPCEGDFDNNDDVDGGDLGVFAANFGRTDRSTSD